jgi:hypothetical protein
MASVFSWVTCRRPSWQGSTDPAQSFLFWCERRGKIDKKQARNLLGSTGNQPLPQLRELAAYLGLGASEAAASD